MGAPGALLADIPLPPITIKRPLSSVLNSPNQSIRGDGGGSGQVSPSGFPLEPFLNSIPPELLPDIDLGPGSMSSFPFGIPVFRLGFGSRDSPAPPSN